MQKTLFYIICFTSLILNSCIKYETDEPKTITTIAKCIEINGKTSGKAVEIPEYTYSINQDHFEAMAKGINIFEDYLSMLNYIPVNSNITINSKNSISYNWVNTNDSLSSEVWYTIDKSEGQRKLTYDMAIDYFEYSERSFDRLNIMTGWCGNNKTGHIKANYGLFMNPKSKENFIYEWVNLEDDFLFTVNYNLEDGQITEDTKYKVQVFPDGTGKIDFSITNEPNTAYHYQWINNWEEIDWTYTIDDEIQSALSGQWLKP